MAKNVDVCRFCGEEKTGKGCPYSPTGIHVKIGDDTKCIYCGSTAYGKSCAYNDGKVFKSHPAGFHIHGHTITGKPKCIYCGSSNKGSGCPYSPTGKHVF